MKNLEKLFEEAQTELKTMIVFHKAERTFRAAESHVFKDHQLTPTQFSVLETKLNQIIFQVFQKFL